MRSLTNYFKLIAAMLCCIYSVSTPAYAAVETKILAFEQVLNPGSNQANLGSIILKDVNPALSIWVSLYYVGIKENDERDTYHQFSVQTEGLEVPDDTYDIKLISDTLPNPKKFQLDENDDVAELMEDSLEQNIKPVILPISFNPKKIRVYSRTIDFVQDINNHGTIQLGIVNGEEYGLRPLGLYMVVGQGEKPEALTSLTTDDVKLEGDGMPDKTWRRYGIIDPISGFMIFLVVAGALIYIKRKN